MPAALNGNVNILWASRLIFCMVGGAPAVYCSVVELHVCVKFTSQMDGNTGDS